METRTRTRTRRHPRVVQGTEAWASGGVPPLLALVYCRAVLAIEGWQAIDLRGMSLAEAMTNVGHIDALEVVSALRAIDDLSTQQALDFHEACRKVADATEVLSLVVEPRSPAR